MSLAAILIGISAVILFLALVRKVHAPQGDRRAAASLVVEWFPDQPVMTVRIRDSSLPKAVGLIGDWKDFARPGTNRLGCGDVGVIHDEVDANRCPVEGLRAQVERLWVLVNDKEPQPVDRHLGDHVPRRRSEARLFDGAKRIAVELDRRTRVPDSQHRRQRRRGHDGEPNSAHGDELGGPRRRRRTYRLV
jgi:hypothetical protein